MALPELCQVAVKMASLEKRTARRRRKVSSLQGALHNAVIAQERGGGTGAMPLLNWRVELCIMRGSMWQRSTVMTHMESTLVAWSTPGSTLVGGCEVELSAPDAVVIPVCPWVYVVGDRGRCACERETWYVCEGINANEELSV